MIYVCIRFRASKNPNPSKTTHNVAVTYDMSDLGTVRVGANNVGNKDPLLDKFGSQVDEYQYSLTGRVIFLEYSIEM